MVKTWPSNAGSAGSIPGRGAKSPIMSCSQESKTKIRSNIVTNSIQTLKIVHIREKKK